MGPIEQTAQLAETVWLCPCPPHRHRSFFLPYRLLNKLDCDATEFGYLRIHLSAAVNLAERPKRDIFNPFVACQG